MIYRATDPDGKNIELLDCRGARIPGVLEYDSETQKATIVLFSKRDGKLSIVSVPREPNSGVSYELFKIVVHIPGSKIRIKKPLAIVPKIE